MNKGIVTCPNCKMRVLPRQDETCPSCQAVISSKKSRVERKPSDSQITVQVKSREISKSKDLIVPRKSAAIETITDDPKIKTRKMNILELFGESWKYYIANFVKILLITICIYIPINTIVLLIPVHESLQDDPVRLTQLYARIYQGFETWVGCIATVGIAAIVEGTILGNNLSWGEALRKGFSRWGSAVGTSIISGFILFGLFLLLIVPGIIWSVYYTFSLSVVALRNIGGKTALNYSKNLVVGQWWRVLGIIIVIVTAQILVGAIVYIPFAFLPDNLILNVMSSTTSDVINGLFKVMSIVFFLNTDYLKNNIQSQNQPVDLISGA